MTSQAIEQVAERSSVALRLPENLTFDEWRQYGKQLLEGAVAVMWWIGDWLNYGERRYGQTYTMAVDMTGLELGTLANAKRVAAAIETSRRREVLSFSHHADVAALDPAEQDAILDEAATRGWTRQDLRAHLRERRPVPDPPPLLSVSRTVVITVPADAERELDRAVTELEAALRGWFAQRHVDDVAVDVRSK